MTIYPAIDIKGGRCVRLLQGLPDRETVYGDDPAQMAQSFRDQGAVWVHVVDLDGAFSGEPRNAEAIRRICQVGLLVQCGGGLRTRAAVDQLLQLGVRRAVIGTRAAESEAFIAELVAAYGDRIAVGIDAKEGQVAVQGWATRTDRSALALARRMDALGVATLIHTDIGTDGMLTGPNLPAQSAMASAIRSHLIASGGISRQSDVESLAALAKTHPNLEGVIVGKALYEKRVSLPQLLTVK